MKLKHLITTCLSAFFFSAATILVIGLWVAPAKSSDSLSTKNLPVTTAGTPASSTQTASQAQQTANNPPSSTSQTPTASQPQTSTKPASASTPTQSGSSGSGTSAPPTSAPPTTAPPPPPPGCGSAGGSCTTAQVAAHNSAGNCWIIYNGGYYIVTSYVNVHPGGTAVFNSSTCGQNITGYLNGSQSTAGKQHAHKPSAYTVLNSYYVGAVI